MRDIILTLIIVGLIPFVMRAPVVGLLAWVWLSVMNPHRLTWGWAHNLPFAQVVAIGTLISMVVNRDKIYKANFSGAMIFMVLFTLWIGVSPFFSFHPADEYEPWLRAVKIQVMVLTTFYIIGVRRQLDWLVIVLAVSIGFYGVKGGLFTVVTGGNYRVWGPEGSFISDNNTLALAIIMVMPLFRYMQLQARNAWQRYACIAAMILCAISAIGSQSRGAFLAISAMSVFLFIKSRSKFAVMVLIAALVPFVLMFMPEQWFERMSTIQTHEQDSSAMGRINAWMMAFNLATDRFPIGGGFTVGRLDVFQRYAPDPTNPLTAHSIYFQVLGEHGFVGLALFVMIFLLAWRSGSWVLKNTADKSEYAWARDLAGMAQVSLIGYAVGGAFLSLTYYDLPYYIAVLLIVLKSVVIRDMSASKMNSNERRTV